MPEDIAALSWRIISALTYFETYFIKCMMSFGFLLHVQFGIVDQVSGICEFQSSVKHESQLHDLRSVPHSHLTLTQNVVVEKICIPSRVLQNKGIR